MKVLVVHNRYRSAMPSGENNVVDAEVELLRNAGVDVHTFIRSSDEIASMPLSGRVAVALSPIDGRSSRQALREMLDRVRPDVVHLHNPYPLVSPTVIDDARERGIAVVATINNFRLVCLNGYLFRDGAVCTDCEGHRVPWSGVVHSCYRDSLPQSAVMATALASHRARWDRVNRFLAVSEFVAERLRRWGVPDSRILLKPNSTPDAVVTDQTGLGYLFTGRLSEEKGILMLLDAWVASGLDGPERLVIAGDGPLRDEVAARAARSRSVHFVGRLSVEEVREWRRATAVSVFPSIWFEAMSAAPESFACGRPVIATRMGGLSGVVDDTVGWSVEPTVDGLVAALRDSTDAAERDRRGTAARARFDLRFAPDVLMRHQLQAYEAAVADPV